MKIPITKPCFGPEEHQALIEPLETGWIVQGPRVAEFERRFAEFSGAPFAVATSSCTSALHLALVILGALDAHELATAVAAGEEVDENEYRVEILYKIASSVHKNAVYRGKVPTPPADDQGTK